MPAYRLWIKFGDALNWINSRIILGVLFYVLIMPIGFILRLMGKGRIREMEKQQTESLRQPSLARASNHVERLF
jgi:Tfp pilus assembly protein PilO